MKSRLERLCLFVFALCVIVICSCNPRVQPLKPPSAVVKGEVARNIDHFLERLTYFDFAGQVLVEEKGKVILKKAYGLADRSSNRPVTLNTVFTVASLGKQFTSTAILKLESEGKLSTDNTIDEYFENVPEDKKGITLFHLLTHSSGLPYHMDGNFEETGVTDQQIIDKVLDLPLLFEPGESRSYSNPGYNLLGFIVEKITGRQLEDYLKEEFFKPLGMNHTGYQGERDWEGAHSYGDSYDYGDISAGRLVPKAIGAGGQLSTVGDLYKWELALRENDILNKKTTEKLFTPFLQNEAMGWRVYQTPRGTNVILHAGDFQGMNVEYRRYPDEKRTIIFMSSTRKNADGYRRPLMNMISYALEGQPLPDLPEKEADRQTEDLKAGSYMAADGNAVISIIKKNGSHYLVTESQEALDFLSAVQDEQRALLLNQQSEQLIERIMGSDWSSTQNFLNGNLSPANIELTWTDLMEEYEAELGEPKEYKIHGTYLSDPAMAFTYFTISFLEGSKTGTLVWLRDRLLAFHFHNPEPLYLKLIRTEDQKYYNYSAFTDLLLKVEANGESLIVDNAKIDARIKFSGTKN